MKDSTTKETILIVDDEPGNIKTLVGFLGTEYRVLAATSGEQAISLLMEQESNPDIILLDVLMPGYDGYDVMISLKEHPETKDIPVIFITARTEPDDEARGLEAGAVDYIGKPFHPVIVKARIRTHLELKKHRDNLDNLVSERTKELVSTREEIVLRLAKASETRDNETGMHIIRLSKMCGFMGRAYGMTKPQAETLSTASLMHDVGKIGIPDAVLLKPGRLTPEERELMETHTTIGANILANGKNELLIMGQDIALTHHERWDGTGYPNGLKEDEISIEGRITAICDVFDALTSVRPYKKAWSVDDACGFLLEKSGSMFDPQLVDLFMENLEQIVAITQQFQEVPVEPRVLIPC